MPCQFFRSPSGGSMIICCSRSRAKPKPCWECDRPHQFLCDGPADKGDCNRRLCTHHRVRAEAGVDYCRECDPARALRLL